MHKRIPDTVQPILEYYTQLVKQKLPGFLTAFYIHGSIALDAFNQRFSDIDFITVVSRRSTEREIDCLRLIHQEVQLKHPQWELEGE